MNTKNVRIPWYTLAVHGLAIGAAITGMAQDFNWWQTATLFWCLSSLFNGMFVSKLMYDCDAIMEAVVVQNMMLDAVKKYVPPDATIEIKRDSIEAQILHKMGMR